MRTMDILGIILKDYPLRESLKLTERYMKNGALNVIVYVSQKRLMQASEDEKLKKWIEQADLMLYSDPDVLSGEGTVSKNRQKEIENHEYLHEFLRKAARNRRKIYLLSDSAEHVQTLCESLQESQSGLVLAGQGILSGEGESEEDDRIVNEINDIAPGVIIAQLPFEQCCRFVEQNRRYINADVILELPEEGMEEAKKKGFSGLAGFVYRKLFRHKLKKYNSQEKTE